MYVLIFILIFILQFLRSRDDIFIIGISPTLITESSQVQLMSSGVGLCEEG